MKDDMDEILFIGVFLIGIVVVGFIVGILNIIFLVKVV